MIPTNNGFPNRLCPQEKGITISRSGGWDATVIHCCTELLTHMVTANVHQGWMSRHVGGVPADHKQGTWTDRTKIQEHDSL